jgi:hypothetical protein
VSIMKHKILFLAGEESVNVRRIGVKIRMVD